MQSQPTITFLRRGLPGLLCIGFGLVLCFVFRHSSPYPAEVKQLLFPVELVLAVGGAPLVSSYVHQRPWQAMRQELLGIGAMLVMLLAWQLSGWLG